MLATQKFAEETIHTPDHVPTLTPHLEHFDQITSAVMCPATEYWHRVMTETIVEAVNVIGFDGVYVGKFTYILYIFFRECTKNSYLLTY